LTVCRCFCGATVDPKLSRLVLPHSCGMSCQRKRATCDHPCPLSCHPGPCPPCSTIIVKPCYCGTTSLSIRCNRINLAGEMPLSCGAKCNKALSCGNHRCEQVCHPDDCLPCDQVSRSKCYCGRESRILGCGEGETAECSDATQAWEGRFSCDAICERWASLSTIL
jgi:transcriptional repressor NF-X1